MSTSNKFDLFDQLEDLYGIPTIRNVPNKEYHRRISTKSKPKHLSQDEMAELAEQENEIKFSYSPSKHEREWLVSSLQDFYRQQWFDDVLRLIKGGGKEASVYQCLGNETTQSDYIAAKVYRPRKFRQLRNDSLYRQGRQILDDEGHELHDDRALHAVRQRTTFGLRVMHTSWIEYEYQTLMRLHKADADVPEPYASGNNAILMSYVGWDDLPAPTLNTVNLKSNEARRIFDQIIHNVKVMLENHLVHGDLSAYNILYCDGDITLIDFPQAVDPDVNQNAYPIFCRDILRLCEYFQEQGMRCDPLKLAENLWVGHGFKVKQPGIKRLLDLDDLGYE